MYNKSLKYNCNCVIVCVVKCLCKTINIDTGCSSSTSAIHKSVRHKTGCYQLPETCISGSYLHSYGGEMCVYVHCIVCESLYQKIRIFFTFLVNSWIVQFRAFGGSNFTTTTVADVKILWSAAKQSSELCPEVSNIIQQNPARGKCLMTKMFTCFALLRSRLTELRLLPWTPSLVELVAILFSS